MKQKQGGGRIEEIWWFNNFTVLFQLISGGMARTNGWRCTSLELMGLISSGWEISAPLMESTNLTPSHSPCRVGPSKPPFSFKRTLQSNRNCAAFALGFLFPHLWSNHSNHPRQQSQASPSTPEPEPNVDPNPVTAPPVPRVNRVAAGRAMALLQAASGKSPSPRPLEEPMFFRIMGKFGLGQKVIQ